MFPMSSVGLTKTLAPAPRPVDAMVRTPTDDSGFCCILAPTTKFAASCWLSCRVGVKSPFLMNSLVSRQIIVLSRGMVAGARALYARRLFTGWSWSKPLVTLLLRGDARVVHKFSAELARSQALSGVVALLK